MPFENFTYIAYIAMFSWLPVGLLLLKYHKYVKKNLRVICKTFVLTFPVVAFWDGISIYSRAWGYNPDRIINIYLSVMPIEEIIMLASSVTGISVVTVLFYEFLYKRGAIK